MHELAITEGLVDAVTGRLPGQRGDVRQAGDRRAVRGGRRLRAVLLRPGHRGNRPRRGHAGDRAAARDVPLPCLRQRFEPAGPIALCPCGSAEVTVLTGQDLKITSVQVA